MRMIFIILGIIPISLFAFFSQEIDPVKEALLDKAVAEDNFEEFKNLLGSKTISSTKGEMNKGFGHYLLGLSTSPKNWPKHLQKQKRYQCRYPFVEYLIKCEAVPKNAKKAHKISLKKPHLTGAINNICPKVVKLFSEKVSPEEIASAAKDLRLERFDSIANDPNLAPKLIEVVQILGKKNKSLCKKDNSNCSAVSHLQNEIALLEKREQEKASKKAYYATKKGQRELIKNKACFHHQEYLYYINKIKEEKERGKLSGFVNASSMKEWGDYAYAEKKERDKYLNGINLVYSKKICAPN